MVGGVGWIVGSFLGWFVSWLIGWLVGLCVGLFVRSLARCSHLARGVVDEQEEEYVKLMKGILRPNQPPIRQLSLGVVENCTELVPGRVGLGVWVWVGFGGFGSADDWLEGTSSECCGGGAQRRT